MSRRQDGKYETPFAGLDVPGPPAALRESVLGKAREALAREPVPDSWTRIWESRPARLAWATCVVGLVVANLAVAPRQPGSGNASRVAREDRSVVMQDEVAELARLPRLDLGLLSDDPPAPDTSPDDRSDPTETGEEENS